jgi:hypothetical protein
MRHARLLAKAITIAGRERRLAVLLGRAQGTVRFLLGGKASSFLTSREPREGDGSPVLAPFRAQNLEAEMPADLEPTYFVTDQA